MALAPARASRPRTYAADSASVNGPSRQRAASRSARPVGRSSRFGVSDQEERQVGGPVGREVEQEPQGFEGSEIALDQVGIVDRPRAGARRCVASAASCLAGAERGVR